MNYLHWIAACLADAILMDAITKESLLLRISEALEDEPAWLDKLCRHILRKTKGYYLQHNTQNEPQQNLPQNSHAQQSDATRHSDKKPLNKAALTRIIVSYAPFAEACRSKKIVVRKFALEKSVHVKPLHPDAPPLRNVRDLEQWLGVTSDELLWLQGHWKSHHHANQSNHHYRYRWIDKADGRQRLLEIPKYHLKMLQKRIYQQMLVRLPVHASAHGFRTEHSCLTHAAEHLQQPMLIKFDLQEFFPSVDFRKVFRIFSRLGYDAEVARVLAHLTTHTTPTSVLATGHVPSNIGHNQHSTGYYHQPHLPQGAPTSPVLANLAAYHFDKRLQGLAESLGLRYSRYADDGALSGSRMSSAAINRLHATIAAIALEEGFIINTRKTKVLSLGQQQRLTHIVVNQHPNLPRHEYDQLKAILFNCVRKGPASQNHARHENFKEHLRGRITYAAHLNPAKAEKLWNLYGQIIWG